LAKGVRARAVLLINPPDTCAYRASVAATIKGDLAPLGIDVELETKGSINASSTHWDMALWNWYADYPDPSDFVNGMFDAQQPLHGLAWSSTWGRYDDPQFIREMRATYRTQGPARAAAYRQLVTQMLLHSPPAAVWATIPSSPQLFSSRVGCQIFRPQDSGLVDLAALCIRSKN
jgi:ABC-type transport system substrate-binding protein